MENAGLLNIKTLVAFQYNLIIHVFVQNCFLQPSQAARCGRSEVELAHSSRAIWTRVCKGGRGAWKGANRRIHRTILEEESWLKVQLSQVKKNNMSKSSSDGGGTHEPKDQSKGQKQDDWNKANAGTHPGKAETMPGVSQAQMGEPSWTDLVMTVSEPGRILRTWWEENNAERQVCKH